MTKKKSSTKKKEELVGVQTLEPNKYHDEGDEPSWYHYLIVIGAIIGVFIVFYIGFSFYEGTSNSNLNVSDLSKTYIYPHKVGNATYNLHFTLPVDDLNSLNYLIEPNKLDILNTANFTMVFKVYNGTDNGRVAQASTKLISFMKLVYGFRFEEDSFKRYEEDVTCDNSTKLSKLVIFDPYQNKTEALYNQTNGCIELNAVNSRELIYLTDKLILNLVK